MCSLDCGGGTRNNTRTKEVTEKYDGECESQISEIEESCNTHECPGSVILF